MLCAAGLSPAEATSGHNVNIVINGRTVVIPAHDQPAFIRDDRTYVPVRVVSENLGSRVDWRSETRQVVITSPAGTLPVPDRPGGPHQEVELVVDGRVIPLDLGEPFITPAGRTVLPLRAVGEALDCEVHWDGAARLVAISARSQPFPPPSRGDARDPLPTPPGGLLHELAGYRTNLRLLDGTLINSAALLGKEESDFNAAELEHLATLLGQLQRYDQQVRLPDGRVWATADVTIQGPAIATADQLQAWVTERGVTIPDGLADLYLEIGAEYGIRGDLAFAQAAKETHYWQYTGLVQPDQYNYCGLWATGSPLTGGESLNGADSGLVRLEPSRHGATFASPEIGVEAHIQHLYAYATTDPLPPGKVLLSPRFNLVQRGCAPTWQGLNARWAVPGTTYGQSVIHDYWVDALGR